jgi:hypothetical protein
MVTLLHHEIGLRIPTMPDNNAQFQGLKSPRRKPSTDNNGKPYHHNVQGMDLLLRRNTHSTRKCLLLVWTP